MSPSQLRLRGTSSLRIRLRDRSTPYPVHGPGGAAAMVASTPPTVPSALLDDDAADGAAGDRQEPAVAGAFSHRPVGDEHPVVSRVRGQVDAASSDASSGDEEDEEGDEQRARRTGRTKLYVSGFEYTRANTTQAKITYRCSYYRSQECPARLVFYSAVMDYDFANAIPHTCSPPARAPLSDQTCSTTVWIKQDMQRDVDSLAVSGNQTPLQIWDVVRAKYFDQGDHTVVRGLSKAQVLKRVHRTRALHFGSDMHGRVEVPPLSRVLNSTLNFFQFHHVWTSAKSKLETKLDRVIGWAHPSLTTLLRYTGITLFIDATFRCVPGRFKQCVVVMVYDRGTKLYVPVFFVLTGSKTYESYWNILQYISDALLGERLSPQQIVCDFESALINAVGDWFPDADIIGCLFHWKQACQRKMRKYRISRPEISVAMERGALDMLTVIPREKIAAQGIAWVQDKIIERCGELSIEYSMPKWGRFWAYFKRTWLYLLPPKYWNVHGIRQDVIARTNNPLERFNRELNAAFPTPHPSVPRFVQTIEEMSRGYVRLRDDIGRGIAEPPKRPTRYDIPQPVSLPDVDVDSGAEASGTEDGDASSDSESGFDSDSDVDSEVEGVL